MAQTRRRRLARAQAMRIALFLPGGAERLAAGRAVLEAHLEAYKGWGDWKPPGEPPKHSLKRLRELLALHDRYQADSDARRARVGRRPLREGATVRGWRLRVCELLLQEVEKAGARRKEALPRAEARLAERLRAAQKAGVPMHVCAERLGMSREGIYKLLNRVQRADEKTGAGS